MTLRTFGGNIVSHFTCVRDGRHDLGAGPYEYFLYQLVAGETLSLRDLRSCSVYLLERPQATTVAVLELGEVMATGDCAQAEDQPMSLHATGGPARLLVAGTRDPHPELRGLAVKRHADLYHVDKPWGHEIWINGQHPRYALKQIKVNRGTKTSLQYHHFKQETNVLFEGTARLHYKSVLSVANDRITGADVASVELQPVSVISVTPPTLHRLEAVTDILLYEVSTPHLDDVVRVQDDTRRPDGRIDAEHRR